MASVCKEMGVYDGVMRGSSYSLFTANCSLFSNFNFPPPLNHNAMRGIPPGATSVQARLGRDDADVLTDYLEGIHRRLDYKKWFFGHYHEDRVLDRKDMLLYYNIVPIYGKEMLGG